MAKWHQARGTIVESPDLPPGAPRGMAIPGSTIHPYVVDIPMPDGQELRATVSMTGIFVLPVGEPIMVEVNTKTREARVDLPAMKQLVQQRLQAPPISSVSPGGQGVVRSMTSPPSLGSDGGRGSAEQRLEQLQNLLDKGILTESEFQAKRQQIISEL